MLDINLINKVYKIVNEVIKEYTKYVNYSDLLNFLNKETSMKYIVEKSKQKCILATIDLTDDELQNIVKDLIKDKINHYNDLNQWTQF